MQSVKKIVKQVENGDFTNIPQDMNIGWLTHMYKAIQDTPGAKEWIKKHVQSTVKGVTDNEIYRKIINHPEVKKDELSGHGIAWIFCQYKIMYTKGYDYWVNEVLKDHNIRE